MDDNVMSVLQMLQDGKISAHEAETLIAALRGETTTAADAAEEKAKSEQKADKEKQDKEDKSFFGGFEFDKMKPSKEKFDDIGEKISQAVGRVQPEKIVRRLQLELRKATRAGSHWSSSVSSRVRNWTEGEDARPQNLTGLPEHTENYEQEFHLEAQAKVYVENPLGNVKVTGIDDGPAVVVVSKVAWSDRADEVKTTAAKIEITMQGTDGRLDVKVSAPDMFREGTVDLELRVPRSVGNVRVNSHFGNVELAELDNLAEGVTTSGDLNLHDLRGDARGETMSGDLNLANITGAATVATQSGDIHAEHIGRGLSANTASGDVSASHLEGGRIECKSVSGDVKVEQVGANAPLDVVVESISGDATLKDASGNIAIKAVSGDVHASELTATRLQAQTVSGDVELQLREAFSSTMQINTVSGDVKVSIPEGSNVRLSLSTTSGDLRCEHDATAVTATETLWTGQIGTGAGTLNVQSISGDAHILRA